MSQRNPASPNLLTLAQCAEKLQIDRPRPARWLKLAVLQREREVGRQILVRHGKQVLRTHYLVNMSTLRRWYPSLFDRRDDVLQAAKTLTKGTDAKLGALDDRLDEIDRKLGVIADAMRVRGLMRKTGT